MTNKKINLRKVLNMRKITLSRPQKVLLPFSKGKIIVNGNECAVVKAGKTVVFEVPDDARDIQVIFAGLPPTNSNVLFINQIEGDISLEVKITVPLSNEVPTYAELKII